MGFVGSGTWWMGRGHRGSVGGFEDDSSSVGRRETSKGIVWGFLFDALTLYVLDTHFFVNKVRKVEGRRSCVPHRRGAVVVWSVDPRIRSKGALNPIFINNTDVEVDSR